MLYNTVNVTYRLCFIRTVSSKYDISVFILLGHIRETSFIFLGLLHRKNLWREIIVKFVLHSVEKVMNFDY